MRILPEQIPKLLILIAIVLLITTTVISQDAASELRKLNSEISSLVSKKKLKKAENLAVRAVALARKSYGDSHIAVAIFQSNLGDIQFKRKRYAEAISSYEGTLSILLAEQKPRFSMIYRASRNLITSYGHEEKYAEGLAHIDKVKSLMNSDPRVNPDEIIRFLLVESNLAVRMKDPDRAHRSFLDRYRVVLTKGNLKLNSLWKIEDSHGCFTRSNYLPEIARVKRNEFFAIKSKFKGSLPDNMSSNTAHQVLNGKAIKLVRPARVKTIRPSVVLVRVLVGVDGTVKDASTPCGENLMQKRAVKAALASRFEPTIVEGQPVEVTGVIVYRYGFKDGFRD